MNLARTWTWTSIRCNKYVLTWPVLCVPGHPPPLHHIYMITSSQCSTVQSTCGFTLSVHYTGGKIASSLLALLLAQHITTVEFYYLHRLQHTHHRASETKLELFQIVRVILIIYNLLFQIFHKLRISA